MKLTLDNCQRWVQTGTKLINQPNRGDDMSQAQLEWYGVPSSEAAKMTVLAGCWDMLREAAKHFRCLDQQGHARMADLHANSADQIINA